MHLPLLKFNFPDSVTPPLLSKRRVQPTHKIFLIITSDLLTKDITTSCKGSNSVPSFSWDTEVAWMQQQTDTLYSLRMLTIFLQKEKRYNLNAKRSLVPFVPNAPFLHPLKTSENLPYGFLMFSGGREKVHWVWMG